MSLSSFLNGKSGVSGGLTADLSGRVLEVDAGSLEERQQNATVTAAAVSQLMAAGDAAGLPRLEMLLVKGPRGATVTGVRSDVFVLVTVGPANGTADVENAVRSWTPEQKQAPEQKQVAEQPAAALPKSGGEKPAADPAVADEPNRHPSPDPWAVLRRALVRGRLTEASARQRELGATPPAAAGRPGSEILKRPELERAMRVLLEGIGSVLAGDGIGGYSTLNELTLPSQQNLSFRWSAHYWSIRAALKSGTLAASREHVKELLAISRQLDLEAQAVSHWTAAEVLTYARNTTHALGWLKEARLRFERLGDPWGLAHTWFVEARIMALCEHEQESAAAAQKACAIDPGWDEPPTFLARRALMRGDLAAAEEILQPVKTSGADRVRGLIDAIRRGEVSQADASAFLKEQDAPPNGAAIKTLTRIANAAPNFLQAREALAWMLLMVGKYANARTIFRGLLGRQLTPLDRASVMLGLGCIANAQHAGDVPEKRLRAAVSASAATPPGADGEAEPLPALGSPVVAANEATTVVFSGQLSGFALPDLLEFLRGAQRTGLLVCISDAGMAALRFRGGLITGAASPGTPDIGQILVSAGKLPASALRAVTERQRSESPGPIGELLVREGLVDVATAQEALTRQIDLTIRELVRWVNGKFAFNRDENGPPESQLSVAVDPQVVLLNMFKEADEASRSPG